MDHFASTLAPQFRYEEFVMHHAIEKRLNILALVQNVSPRFKRLNRPSSPFARDYDRKGQSNHCDRE
jgi:hypothetical protein